MEYKEFLIGGAKLLAGMGVFCAALVVLFVDENNQKH